FKDRYQRVNMKFCFKLGKSASETHKMLTIVYRDEAVTRKTVYEWFKCFREGRQTIENDPQSGRLSTSRTAANFDKVHELLMWDWRLSVRMMAEEFHIPCEIVTEVTELSHPPYSPNLVPPDFFLFPKLKFALKGHRFFNISHFQVPKPLSSVYMSILYMSAGGAHVSPGTHTVTKQKPLLHLPV
uniref:Mos1 transposase HTH domain-containing protein n=1 Tax=Podarcis muralis TaxID=64176 RepID=A0A670JLM1_PODMU